MLAIKIDRFFPLSHILVVSPCSSIFDLDLDLTSYSFLLYFIVSTVVSLRYTTYVHTYIHIRMHIHIDKAQIVHIVGEGIE